MSGILFQINHDGLPVDRKNFLNMFSRIEHRGGDGSNHLFSGNVAMGCHYFWTTPEDVGEVQPAEAKDKKIWLLFDGRIDNRDELIENLGIEKKSEGLTDAALIVKAFQRWKENCFAKLIGSFAIIIYLPGSKKVIAVRDQVGDRTLFYHKSRSSIIISSEPYSILANSAVPKILNKNKVAEYLAIKHPTDNSTYFKGVYEILPSQVLSSSENKFDIKRYWNFNLSDNIRYQNDNDYSEHLLELLDKSVSSKMRSLKPPGVMMSGGLDSTSIAAIASKYVPGSIKTFSYTFNKYKDCDESEYIDYFCKMYDADSFRVNGDDFLPLVDLKNPCISPNFPNQDSYQVLKNELYKQVENSGSNVLLTGWYADQLFAGAEYWLKDSLRDLNFSVFLKNIKPLISENGLSGLLSNSSVRTALRPFRHIKNFVFGHPPKYDSYYYLTSNAKSLLSEEKSWNSEISEIGRPAQILNVLGLRTAYDASACSHCTTGVNLDFRYPFRDLRVIDFFLKIPAYQLYDSTNYKSKYILRNAMDELLPKEILERKKITLFIELLDKSYDLIKDDMNSLLEKHYDELGEYIEKNVLNVIINKKYRDFEGLESNLFWSSNTYLEWKTKFFE